MVEAEHIMKELLFLLALVLGGIGGSVVVSSFTGTGVAMAEPST
jgi:hypothetical protein